MPDGQTVQNSLEEAIKKSRETCHDAGLDPDMPHVLLPKIFEKQTALTPTMKYLRDNLLKEILVPFYAALNRYKSVLFYAHEDKIIFSQRGNAETLAYLNSIHIGIGSSLDDQYMGATAASFVNTTCKEASIDGCNHYLNILKAFSSYCIYIDNEYHKKYYIFILSPSAAFEMALKDIITITNISRNYAIANYKKTLAMVASDNYYSDCHAKEIAMLILDSSGAVIEYNNAFKDLADIHESSINEISFSKIIPNYENIITTLKSGRHIKTNQIMPASNKNRSQKILCIEGRPIFIKNELVGMIISFVNESEMNHKNALFTFSSIIGNSKLIKDAKTKALKASKCASPVIITSNSGTGKEIFAQAIHNHSNRRNAPFVALNCAAIPPELMMSELFGYEEGAFTGAKKGGYIGKIRYADKGTLFLDEIGEMPLTMQSVFLRFLEDNIVYGLGGNKYREVDVRIICATNCDLYEMVKNKQFRLDLYYRLNVLKIAIPALNKRKEDIPLLLDHFINLFNNNLKKHQIKFTDEAIELLTQHPWEGNIRELKNVVEYCLNNAEGKEIKKSDLPDDVLYNYPVYEKQQQEENIDDCFSSYEREKIMDCLKRALLHKSELR